MTPEWLRYRWSLVLVLLVCVVAQSQTIPKPPGAVPADIDAWVERSMKTFEVPGMQLAVIKDGQVVFAKGYGVRKLGDPAPVDQNTLFGIASNTKAFTAASAALLVDEGKISWDDKVIKYLPEFRVADPYITNELTIRDLLSHRTGLGLGQGDLMFWPDTNFTKEQVLLSSRYLKPVASLRSKYAYNNLTFVVASELVARVSGQPWNNFVSERIFKPLGMSSTVVTTSSFQQGGNWASPHSRGWRQAGILVPVQGTKDEVWAGAAGIKSNVVDLSKWVVAQLNSGKLPDGKQLFSEAQQKQMWSGQININITNPSPGLETTKPQFLQYGLGWSLRDYLGHKVVSHGGALTGMVSTIQMIPDQKLGIIVLTNQEETGAMTSLVYHLMDYYLGLPDHDWIKAYRNQRDTYKARANEAEKMESDARARNAHPSLPISGYAGLYHDDWYGNAQISQANGKLVLRMLPTPVMVADLEHWQYDTFKAVFRDNTIPDAYLTFSLDSSGKIVELKMIPTNDLADFSFDYQDLLFKPTKH